MITSLLQTILQVAPIQSSGNAWYSDPLAVGANVLGAMLLILLVFGLLTSPPVMQYLFPNSKTAKIYKISNFVDELEDILDDIEDEELLPVLKRETQFKFFEGSTEGELARQWSDFKKSRKTKGQICLAGEIYSVKRKKLNKIAGKYTLEVIYKEVVVKNGKQTAYQEAVSRYMKTIDQFKAAKKLLKEFENGEGNATLPDFKKYTIRA